MGPFHLPLANSSRPIELEELNYSGMSLFENRQHRITAARTYYIIARQQATRFHQCSKVQASLESGPASEEESAAIFQQIETNFEQKWQAAMIAVTFAGMALEAFFYDYAADGLGDSFVEEHLDKLDLPSKYLVYPKLVCGVGPDKSEHTFELVRKLTALRNRLVHSKSKGFPLHNLDKAAGHYDDYNERLAKGVAESIECVRAVMRELDKLHPGMSFEASMESA
jgi:hypothetical protein